MKKRIIIIIFFILTIITVASVGVSVYLYSQARSGNNFSKKQSNDPDTTMLTTIASVMVLPSDKPTIVSVTDKSKLQDQEFFKKAENGDKVVIFESIRRIILFRPSINKIIDVAPLVFQQQAQPTQATVSAIDRKQASASGSVKSASSSGSQVGEEEQGNFHL